MARREDILGAALAAFDRRGVSAATLDEIRAGSGASIGSIYHHFGDKEGIAEALYAQVLGDYQRGFVAALAGKGAEEGVRAVVEHHLRWAEAHPAGMRFLLGPPTRPPSSPPAGDAVAELNRGFFAEVRGWLSEHPELRAVDLATGHALWLGPATEYCRHWLAGRAPKPDRARRELFADAAWRSLRELE
jgi:AcrR family transcriptional regulator